MTSQQGDVTVQTGESTPIPAPLANPPERASTTLSYRVFRQLCTQFGITEADAILPEKSNTADVAPPGFVAVNRQMYLSGAIPSFNNFSSIFFVKWPSLHSSYTLMVMPF